MVCNNCGKEINDMAEMCIHCGVRNRIIYQKDPAIAAVLSFISFGGGQLYNEETNKFLAVLVIQIINVFLIFFFIGIITFSIVWAYSIIDAKKVALKYNQSLYL